MSLFNTYESDSSDDIYDEGESSRTSEDIHTSLEREASEIVRHQGSQFANIVLNWPCNGRNFALSRELENCTKVPLHFTSLHQYKSIFRSLVKLECWDALRGAKKGQMLKKGMSINILTASQMTDGWTVVEAHVNKKEAIQVNIAEHDLLLVCTLSGRRTELPNRLKIFEESVHNSCYAKIARTELTDDDRKLNINSPQLNINTKLKLLFLTSKFNNQRLISTNSKIFALNTINLISAEREYSAIDEDFPIWLEDSIVKGRTEPLFTLNSNVSEMLRKEYRLNESQACAAAGTIKTNKGISMIHGPPGTGKTSTITAIIKCASDEQFLQKLKEVDPEFASIKPAKKILVCTPSNAAVDELVKRLNIIYPIDIRSPKVMRVGNSKLTSKGSNRNTLSSAIKNNNIFELLNNAGVKVEAGQFNEDYLEQKLRETNESIQIYRQFLREIGRRLDIIPEEEHSKREELKNRSSKYFASILSLEHILQILTSSGNQSSLEKMDLSSKRDEKLRLKEQKMDIIRNASVICTTLSASVSAFIKDSAIFFDIIIIDEAGQCTEPSLLVPLKYETSHVILVGDSKQLPPTVMSKTALQEFNYEQSLFLRLEKTNPAQNYFLNTQYRMNPRISEFPNNTFYQGKLINGTDMSTKTKKNWHNKSISGIKASEYAFFDVTYGMHRKVEYGFSIYNEEEIDFAISLVEGLEKLDNSLWNTASEEELMETITDVASKEEKMVMLQEIRSQSGKLGVISPYKEQSKRMKEAFEKKFGIEKSNTIQFNTVDGFQGQEKEVIIFSSVRTGEGVGFLRDLRRLNVGITRAKSSLWILGNSKCLTENQTWKALIDDAKQRGCYNRVESPMHENTEELNEEHILTLFDRLSLRED